MLQYRSEIAMARRKIDKDSVGRPSPESTGGAPSDVDWQSPRWRDADPQQGDNERMRRLRGAQAPNQAGAIDNAESVDSEAGARPDDVSDGT
jgi:hypothetical protein